MSNELVKAEGLGIQQSSALTEALPDSLNELMSRDPEKLGQQDRARIVSALREQRARWAAAEASGSTRAPRASVGAAPKALGIKSSASDLGL